LRLRLWLRLLLAASLLHSGFMACRTSCHGSVDMRSALLQLLLPFMRLLLWLQFPALYR
jgi:uncharacterized membrane protein YphA (DoxX/SURF4 family)